MAFAEEDRCERARRIQRIDDAFRAGNLEALRAAIPDGVMPLEIGNCLVYAIYHSPIAFIRTLLEIGADPNAEADDGFPPAIAALSSQRGDVLDVLRLLLEFGMDPNQRGINDYTALHMAVAVGSREAYRLLLDAGADPKLATRIDDYETAEECAARAGF